MKIIHLSDLHLGKKLNGFSLIPDQQYILNQIIDIIDDETFDCIIIAGDVYDKPVPPADAVNLFDEFLFQLSERKLPVFVISGNHDSAERIAFGARIMDKSGIYMSPVYDGNVTPVTLKDDYGKVNFYMLPFIRPYDVRHCFKDAEINTYTDAVNTAIDAMGIDFSERNIIISHQLVTGAVTSDSEELSIGGLDNVSPSAFDGFDYTALGHIHRPQNIIKNRIRYCGSPLKYSFSEANHDKSVTVIEMREKGNIEISEIGLSPLREMCEIRGFFDDIYNSKPCEDYMHIILTDEDPVADAVAKLRLVFPNLMTLEYDNKRTRLETVITEVKLGEKKTPVDIFSDFFFDRNGEYMNTEQLEYITKLINEIWEGEV